MLKKFIERFYVVEFLTFILIVVGLFIFGGIILSSIQVN